MKPHWSLLAIAVFLAPPASGPTAEVPGATIEPKEKTPPAEPSYVEQVKKLIDEITVSGREATEKGRKATAEAKDWLKKDFSRIGDWEYKQLTVPMKEIATLEKRLNELGAERWDCFWIQKHEGQLHLLFKRPAISYLHKASQIDFMKLLSIGGGDDAQADPGQ